MKTTEGALTPDQAERLLEDKYGESLMKEGPRLIQAFAGREVHLYHLSKVAAAREAQALFARAGAVLEDHVYGYPAVA